MGAVKHSLHPGPVSQAGQYKKRKPKSVEIGSGEDVLFSDVKSMLNRFASAVSTNESTIVSPSESRVSFCRFDEVEVEIRDLSSLGTSESEVSNKAMDLVLSTGFLMYWSSHSRSLVNDFSVFV
jgi:hypothetical protein